MEEIMKRMRHLDATKGKGGLPGNKVRPQALAAESVSPGYFGT
jgi:hypothetical protein